MRSCYVCDRPGSPALLCADCKRRWAPAPVLIARPAVAVQPTRETTQPTARCPGYFSGDFGYVYCVLGRHDETQSCKGSDGSRFTRDPEIF